MQETILKNGRQYPSHPVYMKIPEKGGNALGYPILILFEKLFILDDKSLYLICMHGVLQGWQAGRTLPTSSRRNLESRTS
jgi:hypothetical protein